MIPKSKKRIAVLASGSGSNFQAIIDACESGYINGEVCLLIYNRKDAYANERAKKQNIPAVYLNKVLFEGNKEKHDQKMLELLVDYKIDLVVLAGYMSKVGKNVVDAYNHAIMNLHPALIPSFCGDKMYGSNVHEAVISYGVKLTGATVHFVDYTYDTGAIILQQAVEVEYSDDAGSVAKKVLEIEHKLLPQAVKLFCENRLFVTGRRVEIK
ncbi:MAG: phosphoribosylglycinamide formyltransferase [Clostridiales bacterium]|nr:phosphoribosylglycinamide formyltransferase [Clostridiales bacterium]